jgi:hypothetical protein
MLRNVTRRTMMVLAVLLTLILMPASGSAATTSQWVKVYATGNASTNWYYYSSNRCSTNSDFVTYMHRGGPSFVAAGISPASGTVYEHFDAVGKSAWGKAYFFRESAGTAFDFYFEGTLQCTSSASGVVRGQWTFGYAYSVDPSTGRELCTRLDGRGTVEVRVDFLRRTTTTTVSGSYVNGATEFCQ